MPHKLGITENSEGHQQWRAHQKLFSRPEARQQRNTDTATAPWFPAHRRWGTGMPPFSSRTIHSGKPDATGLYIFSSLANWEWLYFVSLEITLNGPKNGRLEWRGVNSTPLLGVMRLASTPWHAPLVSQCPEGTCLPYLERLQHEIPSASQERGAGRWGPAKDSS